MTDAFLTLCVLAMYFGGCWASYRWGRYEFLYKLEAVQAHLRRAEQKNRELQSLYEQASRNDTPKDPKTGRFTKRCP